MNRWHLLSLIAIVLLSTHSLFADELAGTVTGVDGARVTVVVKGGLLPNVGDKAEVFFQIDGLEESVSVAKGVVKEATEDTIVLQVEKSSGKVVRDQLVRIDSAKPRVRTRAEVPKEQTVRVPANLAWKTTGFRVTEGLELEITATGTIEASGKEEPRDFYHNVPPEGRDDLFDYLPAPTQPALCLLGRVGDGPIFRVGKRVKFKSKVAGELSLGINDDGVADNSGEWIVKITQLVPATDSTSRPTASKPPAVGDKSEPTDSSRTAGSTPASSVSTIKKGTLGAVVRRLTPYLAERHGLQRDTRGVSVEIVLPESAARRAGLQIGDFIFSIDREPVGNLVDFITAIGARDPDAEVILDLFRPSRGSRSEANAERGQKMTVKVKLAQRPSNEQLIEVVTKAADEGDRDAQFWLGQEYINGTIVKQDGALALHWLRKAALKGDARAQAELGELFRLGKASIAKNETEGVSWLRKSAEQFHPSGQFGLGAAFYHGIGVSKDLPEAVKLWRLAAEQGHILAQTNLGVLSQNGEGVLANHADALKWFREAADADEPEAMWRLGSMYEYGRGVDKNYSEAVSWYRRSANAGHSAGQHSLAVMLHLGMGTNKDLGAAADLMRKAADQGLAVAQSNLGILYRQGLGVEQDFTEALTWFRKAAAQGESGAQLNLGDAYLNGRGVAKDDAEAFRWYRLAAENGNTIALNQVGLSYSNGVGVSQNDVEAVRWFRQAAEKGDSDGESNLGFAYEEGRGVERNEKEAFNWYHESAKKKNMNGQYNVGRLAAQGKGVGKSPTVAVQWLRLAADQGHATAQLYLGYLHEQGEGVTANRDEAISWYRKAATQGNAEAKNALTRLSVNP